MMENQAKCSSFAMSSFASQWNSSLPISGVWSDYLAEAQAQVTALNTRAILLLLVNIPVLAIALNVIRQLVSWADNMCWQALTHPR